MARTASKTKKKAQAKKTVTPPKKVTKGKVNSPKKTTAKPVAKPKSKKAVVKKVVTPKAVTKKVVVKKVVAESSITIQILNVIKKSRAGANVGIIREATGLESKQISNVVFRLARQGRIIKKGRGAYSVK
ncbi:MAG: hypothetical protein V1753_00630 [Pseudomonadota bacterium]